MLKRNVSPSTLLPFTKRGAKMTKKAAKKTLKAADSVLSLDWLEFSCRRNIDYLKPLQRSAILDVIAKTDDELAEMPEVPEIPAKKEVNNVIEINSGNFMYYIVKDEKRRSLLFSEIYNVFHLDSKDEPFATVSTKAHVGFIKDDVTIVKINNKWLYDKALLHNIRLLLNELGLVFVKINRIDICLDFQKMKGNKLPQDFLKKIATLKVRKKGNARKKPIICDKEVQENHIQPYWRGVNVTGVSFGSRKSFLYSIMYNKSLEMRTVKQKPWIVEQWEALGFHKNVDTYRLEFSIKPSKKSLVNTDDGDILCFNSLDFVEVSNREILFRTILDDRFSFVSAQSKVRFDRQKKIELFDLDKENAVHVITRLSDKEESTNHTKYFINTLFRRIHDKDISTFEHETLEFYLAEIISKKHLSNWFINKYPDYNLKEYSPPIEVNEYDPENYFMEYQIGNYYVQN